MELADQAREASAHNPRMYTPPRLATVAHRRVAKTPPLERKQLAATRFPVRNSAQATHPITTSRALRETAGATRYVPQVKLVHGEQLRSRQLEKPQQISNACSSLLMLHKPPHVLFCAATQPVHLA